MTEIIREPNDPPLSELRGEAPDGSNTCESALREAGVDERLIAKKLKEQLEAKQQRWNPKRNAFDSFPDYKRRLAALKEILKIFGSYPSPENDDKRHTTIIWDWPPRQPRPDASDHGERSECSAASPNVHRTTANEPSQSSEREVLRKKLGLL